MRKKTRLVRCPHPGCFELMPEGATGCDKHKGKLCADCKEVEVFHPFTFCPVCSLARKRARTARFNASRAVNRKCACGCERKAAPRSKYAAECSEGIGKEKKAFRNREQAKLDNKMRVEFKPRKKAELSDEEIDRRAIEQVKADRMAEEALAKVRATLDPRLLAMRTYRGAVAIAGT